MDELDNFQKLKWTKKLQSYKMFTEEMVKFIYSKKTTKFSEIPAVDLSYIVTVKSMVETSQNFVTFSGYMSFMKRKIDIFYLISICKYEEKGQKKTSL